MSRILLHEKYGVNPTIPICFWCQKNKNEVVLLGARYRGEAPKNMFFGYEPCSECKANMEKGITLIECTKSPNSKFPEITSGVWPTGRWCVVSEDFVRRMIQPDYLANQALHHRKAFVEPGIIENLVKAHEQAKQDSGVASS